MPISGETHGKMKDIEESRREMKPEEFIEPGAQSWQCPSCGEVYEQGGICPVDETPLKEVTRWTESVDKGGEATAEQVMELGDDLYPGSEGQSKR